MIRYQRIQRGADRLTGNLFLGIFIGIGLELFNIMIGGFATVLSNPLTGGTFRLHHLWVGLFLLLLGAYIHAPFFMGLGLILMIGDYYEHQRPDGTIAPFW